ncbi:PLAC8 family-domain-containing protein [Aspergillus avenaceus]|uniref:PLAC8 family-domain-containing protein n=1 Tax=Aspergillus avenaceus TaxID=36643 RepID=A0A5N6U047_ASPAV|nr:PLAC8 family-domain-containing protein [Aspergillus avenaceus]
MSNPDHKHNEWSNSFWDCCSPFGTCCMSFWLPCCLHGKTHSRLDDPYLKEHSYCNGSCCLYTLTSYIGFHWVPLMMQRTKIRQRFGIDGSGCGDCCSACCCPCCVMMQNEKEVEVQCSRMGGLPGGYQAPGGMNYSAQ